MGYIENEVKFMQESSAVKGHKTIQKIITGILEALLIGFVLMTSLVFYDYMGWLPVIYLGVLLILVFGTPVFVRIIHHRYGGIEIFDSEKVQLFVSSVQLIIMISLLVSIITICWVLIRTAM